MNDVDKALFAYEHVLKYNHYNIQALSQIASIHRSKDQFQKAVEFYQKALAVESSNYEVWCALGLFFIKKKRFVFSKIIFQVIVFL